MVVNGSKLFEELVLSQGKRYSLPNSRIMIHQPLGGAQGQAAGKLIVGIMKHHLGRTAFSMTTLPLRGASVWMYTIMKPWGMVRLRSNHQHIALVYACQ